MLLNVKNPLFQPGLLSPLLRPPGTVPRGTYFLSSVPSRIPATHHDERHVVGLRASTSEILNGAEHRKQNCIGGSASRTAQLRFEMLEAEFLICVIACLEDTVGVSQQYVPNAQFHPSANEPGLWNGAKKRPSFGKRFELTVCAQQQRGRMSGAAVVKHSGYRIEPRQEQAG